ncbi:MAG: hypothetical protein NTY50_20175 [Methylobacter sp.]|nr:hypothetical protein [Methylobacter sp.]
MLTTLRKFTVIFLSILQFIAPLVHAHAGEKVSDLGLHVPGLEMYDVHHSALMFRAVSYDYSADGVIIGIDAGIKNKPAKRIADNSHYLYQEPPPFNTAIPPFAIAVPAQSAQFICRLLIPSLSPRAPPVP